MNDREIEKQRKLLDETETFLRTYYKQKLLERMEIKIENLMYDFKHYDNYQIMAYQNGVKKALSQFKQIIDEIFK